MGQYLPLQMAEIGLVERMILKNKKQILLHQSQWEVEKNAFYLNSLTMI